MNIICLVNHSFCIWLLVCYFLFVCVFFRFVALDCASPKLNMLASIRNRMYRKIDLYRPLNYGCLLVISFILLQLKQSTFAGRLLVLFYLLLCIVFVHMFLHVYCVWLQICNYVFSIHLFFAFRLAHGFVFTPRATASINDCIECRKTGRMHPFLLWTVLLLPVCFSNWSAEDSVGIKPNRRWEINPNLPICVTISHPTRPLPIALSAFAVTFYIRFDAIVR